ncbi:actin-like ATPase domain-containing protein [Wilcoxina mikolae CBS 423.85]|nr:actin-like ATPase domain-containing protein [Wilcoxina mikolae CBS 423.85]
MSSTGTTKNRFVVGVDFGTTFTSVAFAHSSSPKEVKLVQTWPNCAIGKASADQVPTVIHYNRRTGEKKWGYEVVNASSSDALRWFKLLLQDQSKPTESYERDTHSRDAQRTTARRLNSQLDRLTLSGNTATHSAFAPPATTPAHDTAHTLENLKISPVTVVSDFLRLVRDITKTSINRTYGAEFVRGSKVEYVLTIPAIWSNLARARMVEAAEIAGFGSHRAEFNLIGEPESAAVYALKEIQANALKKGDTFIVCDAGGGTVDLIAYKILQMEPLRLDEIVSGCGDLCGSVFLDQAFEQYMRGVVGDKLIDDLKPRSKHVMMQSWEESVKFAFGNMTEEDEYYVNVPGMRDDEDNNIEDGCHTMERNAVERIFDPVVDKIIDLVEEQVVAVQQKGEDVGAILLVGGFGSSEYLLKRLRDKYFGWSSTKLPVLQPPNARTAVVRGALLRGLDGSIVRNRRSPLCYGSRSSLARPKDYNKYWDSERNTWRNGYTDMDKHTKWDQDTDTWRVSWHLNWYITKDDIVGETHSVSMNFFRTVPIPAVDNDFKFTTRLYSCKSLDPPAFKWMNQAEIKVEAVLESDLSSIPRSKFKKTTNARGESFYEVKYALRVELVDEVLIFNRVVDGVIYGETRAKFE